MKIGLIGLPNSGKTTVYNALTKSEAQVTDYALERAEPNLSVVDIADERIMRLSGMYQPKKTVYASIEMIDFPGLHEGSPDKGASSGNGVGLMRNTDALALVIRNFHHDVMGPPRTQDDLGRMDEELLLCDLMVVENRLERIAWGRKRGKKAEISDIEEKALKKIQAHLENNLPVRDLELNRDEERAIRGFQFLTQKPAMVILNSDETKFRSDRDLLEEISKRHDVIEFAGKFEMELALLDDESEAELFMKDMGIDESARDRLTRLAYEKLGYISFFTVGSDEVRAWNIREGATALDAAATIHSDLARGFIRAECFSYADSIDCGSEKAIRAKGRFRLEGKNYRVQDGDILSIRFNV